MFDKDEIKKAMKKFEKEDFDFSTLTEFQQDRKRKPGGEKEPEKAKPTPLEILKERLAKGEIDFEKYKEMKKEFE